MPVGKSSGVAKYTAPAPQQTPTVNGGALAGDFTEFLKLVAKSPALITGYSKVLKAAGYYKGKINGKYNIGLQEALTRAETERASINLISPITRDQFFAQLEPISTGGSKGPTEVVSVTKYTPESASQFINLIVQDTLGRKATAAEIKRYTKTLKNIEKQASTITKYSGAGAKQTQVTTPGINEQQYLVDKISGTDEGKANKVLGFYETFMNALGAK
tara:strand:+ start:2188 stop:2838 length:651 start_codon:yes stop_codon:yes gene_type:complete